METNPSSKERQVLFWFISLSPPPRKERQAGWGRGRAMGTKPSLGDQEAEAESSAEKQFG